MCGIDLFASWILEQTLFESSVGISDIRWMIHLVCNSLIFVPMLVLAIVVKNPRLKLIFRLWMMASVFGFLTVPMKTLYLTAQNETALIQLSSMGLFLVVMLVFKKPVEKSDEKKSEKLPRSGMTGIAFSLVMAILIPWLLWGALGSILDTVLEILVGLLFGLLVVRLAYPHYLDRVHNSEREIRVSDFILDGFVLFVFLTILVAALAHNGSHPVLIITVPVSAWTIVAFSIMNTGKDGHGKFQVVMITAVVLAAPLLFFDMDELSLVIGSGDGEVISWALKTAWFTFMTLLTIFIVLLINFRFVYTTHLPRKWDYGLIAMSVLTLGLVYAIWGQVGFHGDKIFVILKSQADLSTESQIEDYSVRRQAVFHKLTDFATQNQKEIIEKLEKYHIGYTPYYLINGLEVDGGKITQLLLRGENSIDRILDDPQLRPLPQEVAPGEPESTSSPEMPSWNISMINADKVISDLGIAGEGIIIGQTDSGVDGRHDQLEESYRGYGTTDDFNWFDPWNNSPFPTDLGGHGTMTLGIITGKDIGIAPEAQWIGCVNLARNLGNPAKYLDCMQFMLAPFPQNADPFSDGDPSKGAMIVNNSWGCPTVEGCDATIYQGAMDALATAGIFMSAAAGNTGNYGCSSVTDPISIYSSVFTVGSINMDGNLSSFSSFGPVLVDGSNRQKPDLLAPGEQVTSSFPGGGYMTADGTSFAAPHVTGIVALMWSANPSLIGNITTTMQILRQTARPYQGSAPICGDPGSAVGAGIVDAYAAVQAALSWNE
jgi:subtilisin family serine protease